MHETTRNTAPVVTGIRPLHEIRLEADMLRGELAAAVITRAVRAVRQLFPRRKLAAA
ncbi:hypothetical protein M0534_07460 [Methylonatrum kenyense]|uniref:hypothetical protein n=1 Tax=Methylonatrum kenyense TaxID=455253 RepID=UPI0020BDCD71|nr:hypothetical protein [Methylonatrum kenyense]MCK8516161.1 hypothetical protein [Methylonatrum kenyense]